LGHYCRVPPSDLAAPVPRLDHDRRWWVAGADVVLAAQEAFGFPSPRNIAPGDLVDHVRRRQDAADDVVVAVTGAGVAVGHCLLAPPRRDELHDYDWSERFASELGRVAVVGALAVRPGWDGRGIAGELVDDLVARAPSSAVVIAAVWRLNAAANAVFSRRGVVIGDQTHGGKDEHVYRLARPGLR
jgi:GNAT superfamily N-acetyltransferase